MSELSELYQQVILDHNKKPRNFRKLENANRKAEGYNPLCGDRLTLQLKLENGHITGVRFQGAGCAISTASASLMTEAIRGKTPEEAESAFQKFHGLLTEDRPPAPDLGKLAVFSGVREYPMRVKCATLAWHTLRAALRGEEPDVRSDVFAYGALVYEIACGKRAFSGDGAELSQRILIQPPLPLQRLVR